MPHAAESPEAVAALTDALRLRIQMWIEQLVQHGGRVVKFGPFAGMQLSEMMSWTAADIPSKLLGLYECELHAFLEESIVRQPDVVVNVGCAEGYYAIGLARRLAGARVYAFDTDATAHHACADAARINGVAERVDIRGEATAADLASLTRGATRGLVVLDCEGAELQLLDEATVVALRHCDIVVECHDFVNPTITETLERRLGATHTVSRLRETGRDPAGIPFLAKVSTFDRYLMVCEFRPEVMTWLVATPR